MIEQAQAEEEAQRRAEQRQAAPVSIEVSSDAIEVETAVEKVPDEAAEVAPQLEMEADITNGDIPAGAPGSALAALQSGLPSQETPPIVALAPRAVTGGNPDSPSLPPRNIRNRNIRNRRDSSPRREEEARPEIRRPVNNNRLAVPSSNIPIGSGSSSTIFSPPSGGGVGSPPAPPSRAQSLGLYYRVFVEASDPFVQDDVKEVVPDAFRTRYEGRTMMQVGAFPTEEEAEERKRLLERSNFEARVEYIR